MGSQRLGWEIWWDTVQQEKDDFTKEVKEKEREELEKTVREELEREKRERKKRERAAREEVVFKERAERLGDFMNDLTLLWNGGKRKEERVIRWGMY